VQHKTEHAMRHITTLIILIFFGLTVKSQLIIDNGEFLNDNEKSELTTRLQILKDKSTVETLIYTTMDLGGKSPFDYGMDLSRKYPAGIKGINNGIIILLSKNDRKLQIIVGYGLEWVLSDNQTQMIVDQMIPFFKKGEFYNGVNKAIDLIGRCTTHNIKQLGFSGLRGIWFSLQHFVGGSRTQLRKPNRFIL
jgi:uncharacterized membrane protein YgcG